MLKHCVVHGKNIGYFDSGHHRANRGTLLLLHCSGASHRIFNDLIEALSGEFRILAPDLSGYGISESWPENEPYHWQYDVDVVLHMLRLADSPVHCLGYSFGGYLALEACLQAPQNFASLVLAEPAALHALQFHEDEAYWLDAQRTAHRCIDAVASGDLRRATTIYLKFWGSPMTWFFAPKKVKSQIQEKLHKMAKEFIAQESHGSALNAYGTISKPTLFLAGTRSRPSSKALVDLLSQSIPGSQSHWVREANHFNLFNQSSSILPVIQNWLSSHNKTSVVVEQSVDVAPKLAV